MVFFSVFKFDAHTDIVVLYLLCVKGTPEFDAAAARANLSQQHGCMEACRGAGLVVFNMFALEGFHVSEAYSVRRRMEYINRGSVGACGLGCGRAMSCRAHNLLFFT